MRILVVEDDERLSRSIARGLEADGFDVDVSNDGEDGLWKATEGTYGAIVLDVMMPKLNGYQVCRELRAAGNFTPILMLTAKDGEYDEAEGLELGADDYLRKPFSPIVLTARLRALGRRGGAVRAPTLHVGDLVVDPAARTASRNGTNIALTAREFSVLSALADRSPDVLSKAELLHTVWGFDFDGDPNIVEVYVGYLRRKIDRPFDAASLQTVRGVGYRLVADGG